jgi:hypothetical protein
MARIGGSLATMRKIVVRAIMIWLGDFLWRATGSCMPSRAACTRGRALLFGA